MIGADAAFVFSINISPALLAFDIQVNSNHPRTCQRFTVEWTSLGLAIPRSVPRIGICTGRGRIVSMRVACFVSRLFRALVHAMPSISRITKSVMLSTRSRFRMRMIISKKSHERQHREMEGKHALCSGARLSVHDGIRRSRVGDEKACRKVSINTVVSFLVSLLVFVDSNRIEALLRRHFLLVSTAQKLPSITLGASSK